MAVTVKVRYQRPGFVLSRFFSTAFWIAKYRLLYQGIRYL